MKKLYFAYPIAVLWLVFITGHMLKLTPNEWYSFPVAATAFFIWLLSVVYAIEKQ